MNLPPEFTDRINDLCNNGTANGLHALAPGCALSVWDNPQSLVTHPAYAGGLTVYDIQDPNAWRAAFSRTQLNVNYNYAVSEGGKVNGYRLADLAINKAAIDYVAAMERAAHARHASRIRCWAWASARRAGHGSKTYGVFAVVSQDFTKRISDAYATNNYPDVLS